MVATQTKPTLKSQLLLMLITVAIFVAIGFFLPPPPVPPVHRILKSWISPALVNYVRSVEFRDVTDPAKRRLVIEDVARKFGWEYAEELEHKPNALESDDFENFCHFIEFDAPDGPSVFGAIEHVFENLTIRPHDVYNPRDRAWLEDADRLAVTCMKRLIGKGFDADIRRYCESRGPLSPFYGEEMKAILAKLK